jgi:hypothetical protein
MLRQLLRSPSHLTRRQDSCNQATEEKKGHSRPKGRQAKAERELERPYEEVLVEEEASGRLAKIKAVTEATAVCERS